MNIKFLVPLLVMTVPLAGQAQPYFQRSQVISDIDHYNHTLESVHYNPWMHISREAYYRKSDSLKATLPDSIEARDLLTRLYWLSALLGDGHAGPAFVQPILKNEYARKQFLPFVPEYDEKGRLYLPKAFADGHKIPHGARILSINGLDMEAFSKNILLMHGGLPSYRREMSVKFFPVHLFLAGIRAPFTIRYRYGGAGVKTMEITEGAGYVDALASGMPHIRDRGYQFSILEDRIGYFNFRSMGGDYKVLDRFLDSFFTVMRSRNIPALAIDLRQNSGGNSLLGDLLLSYITRKPHSQLGKKHWKVSQPYKDDLLKNGNTRSAYLHIENGKTWTLGNCQPHEPMFKVDSIYTGQVYFLTGPFTFSSANMLADAVKTYQLATLVGEATGESTNDFGESLLIELPATQLRMQTTTSFEVGADCDESHQRPVIPDILVPSGIRAKTGGRDPVIEFLLRRKKP